MSRPFPRGFSAAWFRELLMLLILSSNVRAFVPTKLETTTPSADYSTTIAILSDCSVPVGTSSSSPVVISYTFPARLPNLPPRRFDGMDFAISCSLVLPGRPRIGFLFIRPQFCSTLLSGNVSRHNPCASLSLRPHQAGKRTFTSKFTNMHGTQESSPVRSCRSDQPRAGRLLVWRVAAPLRRARCSPRRLRSVRSTNRGRASG